MMKKEALHLVRNPRVLAIALLMPVLLITLIGFAFSGEVKHISTVIVNEDRGELGWKLIDAIRQNDVFRIKYYANDRAQAEKLIRDGLAKAAIVIPQGFEENVRTVGGYIYVLADGTDPMSAGAISSGAQVTALSFSPIIAVRTSNIALFNPTLRYIDFISPAIMGTIVQFIPTFLLAVSISSERERGTIEQLIVTPIGGFDILLGKILVYAAIGFLDALFVLVISVFLFNLVVRGSMLLVVVFILVFLAACLGLATFVSALSKNQIQAVQSIMPTIYPTIFLSGVFYPIESMPEYVRPFSYFVPLTYMNHALRSVMIKGVGIEAVAMDLLALSLYATIMLLLALATFKKKL